MLSFEFASVLSLYKQNKQGERLYPVHVVLRN